MRWPATVSGERVVAAVVEQADETQVGVALVVERLDQVFAQLAAADDHGASRQPALAGPAPHHEEQATAERQQHEQADDIEAAEPDARELVARLGEERDADGDEEHHRPGGGEAEILLLQPAERLHLINVGDLERDQRHRRRCRPWRSM